MVGTIIPMVHGKRHNHGIPLLLVLHSLCGLAGGAFIGALAAFASSLVWRPASDRGLLVVNSIVGFIAVICSLKELELIRLPMPQPGWIVPRHWAGTKSEARAVSLYGFCLGVGVLTRINTCLYPVIAWAVLVGKPWQGLVVMSIFGICRTVPLWLMYSAATNAETDESLLYTYLVSHWRPAAWMLSSLTLASVGGIFLWHVP